jgi:serine/threonine protein kinase
MHVYIACRNVVGFLDEFLVRDRLFIVMEFVPCNLLELLEAQPGGMDREAVRLIMYQLCTAISFIHSKVGGGGAWRHENRHNVLPAIVSHGVACRLPKQQRSAFHWSWKAWVAGSGEACITHSTV